jgi:hypothetical protein
MKKSGKYIRGKSKPVSTLDKVGTYTGVSGFVHIHKPGTKQGTLCGTVIDSDVEFLEKRPITKGDLCHTCIRIANGQDPVFDPSGAGSSRRDRGTRSKPVMAVPRVDKGKQVA